MTSGQIIVNDMDLEKMPRRQTQYRRRWLNGVSGFPSVDVNSI